jgi:hypothetical protein
MERADGKGAGVRVRFIQFLAEQEGVIHWILFYRLEFLGYNLGELGAKTKSSQAATHDESPLLFYSTHRAQIGGSV